MKQLAPGDARGSSFWRLASVFLTLRGRLILLVCFATVPAILFIFFAAARDRQAALERMQTEARHLGGLASREHVHHLNGSRTLLRRLGDTQACPAAPASPPACPDYLPALLDALPQFANIGVADPSGHVVCSAAAIDQSASLTTNAAFARALDSDDVETGTYAIGFIGRPVLHLAAVVRGTGRAPCAVVFVAVELDWLDQLAHQANLPADYSLFITDRTGRVLARSGHTDADVPQSAGAVPSLGTVLGRPEGAVLDAGVPPTQRYFVATPMEGIPGIFVVASLPYERVQRTANQAFYRTLLGLVLVTIFAVVAAVLAAEFSVLRALRSLTRAVRRFGAGDLTARAPLPGSYGELRELAVSFSAMADALAARQLEARNAQDRLRALSHRLQVARDQEAGRIARELHDELGQILTGLKIELAHARRLHATGAPSAAGEQAMAHLNDQIDHAIDSVRRIASELRPPVLDRLGLAAALDWLVRECERASGLTVLLNVSQVEEPLDPLVATTIFRIAQEALTNIVRHAEATEASIDVVAQDDGLSLTVRDNGKGLPAGAAEGPHALGILGMRERVRLLGGSWRLRSAPGQGTTIEVEVPREPPVTVDAISVLEQRP